MRATMFAALAPALAGCAQLFGIDDTTKADAPVADVARLTLTRVSIGATVVKAPLDESSQSATFYTPNPDNPAALVATPGTLTPPNIWTAPVTGNPIVQFTTPQVTWPTVWELASRDVHGHVIELGDPTPVLAPTTTNEVLKLVVPDAYNGTQAYRVYVVGAWMGHTLTAAEVPMSTTPTLISTAIPYSAFAPIAGGAAAGIQPADEVLVLEHVGNDLTAEFHMPGFTQSTTSDMIGDGTAATALTAVTHDQMLSATVAPAMLNTRFQAVRPAVAGLSESWKVMAAPGHALFETTGPTLNGASIASTDTMVTAMFGNPFTSLGWDSQLYAVAQESRTVTIGAASGTAFAQIVTSGANPTTTTSIEFPAPLPEQVSIDQTQLTSDGLSVKLAPTAPHTVTMVLESSPVPTSFRVDVVELVPNAGGTALERHLAMSIQAPTSTITIPPGVFKPGSTYVLTAIAFNGAYPSIANGDLDQMAPFSYAAVDSGAFTVMP